MALPGFPWKTGQRLGADALDAAINSCLPLAGGTMTGPLTLNADPTVPFAAATKQYVDAIASATGAVLLSGSTMTGALILNADPSNVLGAVTKQYADRMVPKAGGTMTGLLLLSADPAATLGAATKQYVDAVKAIANAAVPAAGGTMTGLLTLSGAPTATLHAATKAYVDAAAFSSPGSLALSGGTMTGYLVLNADPTTFLGAATKQYVDAIKTVANAALARTGGSMTGGLLLSADPSLGAQAATKQYVDATANSNNGRNWLDNSEFVISQRGTGPWSANNAYTLDRWVILNVHTNGSAGVAQNTLTDAQRAAIGDEEATVGLAYTFTGGTGAGDYDIIAQRIEGVQRLSNKIVTVSFWAAASSGTPKIGVSIDQWFGTGGSPSAAVAGVGQSINLTTTYTRYSFTFTLSSTNGKTFGTNGDSYHQLNFWFSCGTTNATRAGSIGVQSGSIGIWGVQLEIGTKMTSLEKLNYQIMLARCQRLYQAGVFKLYGYQGAGGAADTTTPLPVVMRTQPSITPTITTQNNATASVNPFGAGSIEVLAIITATGAFGIQGTYAASAEL
jgi:hypothetical protein